MNRSTLMTSSARRRHARCLILLVLLLSLWGMPSSLSAQVVVDDSGNVGIGTTNPQNALHVRSSGVQQLVIEGNSSWTQMGMKWSTNNFGTLGIGAGGTNNFFILDQNATYRFGVNANGDFCLACPGGYWASNPIDTKPGAYLSAGGVWTNASSRALKQNISPLSTKKALRTLRKLNPVTYQSKADPQERHVGFIAEDVPALVATRDRKSLSAMDIVAVLTKVVQEQQKEIEALKTRIRDLK